MNRDRLDLLAHRLERLQAVHQQRVAGAIEPKLFYMAQDWHYSPADPARNRVIATGDAIAEACFIPKFNTEGLWLAGDMPTYQTDRGYEAGRKFFELPYGTNARLFCVSTYSNSPSVQPAVVAARIRLLLEKGVESFNKVIFTGDLA